MKTPPPGGVSCLPARHSGRRIRSDPIGVIGAVKMPEPIEIRFAETLPLPPIAGLIVTDFSLFPDLSITPRRNAPLALAAPDFHGHPSPFRCVGETRAIQGEFVVVARKPARDSIALTECAFVRVCVVSVRNRAVALPTPAQVRLIPPSVRCTPQAWQFNSRIHSRKSNRTGCHRSTGFYRSPH